MIFGSHSHLIPNNSNMLSDHSICSVFTVRCAHSCPSAAERLCFYRVLLRLSLCLRSSSPSITPNKKSNCSMTAATPFKRPIVSVSFTMDTASTHNSCKAAKLTTTQANASAHTVQCVGQRTLTPGL